MVRIGGGWDTLGNYLERHDPCRSRTSKTIFKKKKKKYNQML